MALVATAASVLFVTYFWTSVLDRIAGFVASQVSFETERRLGLQSIAALDYQYMGPSELPPERRLAIERRFAQLQRLSTAAPRHELLFRYSDIRHSVVLGVRSRASVRVGRRTGRHSRRSQRRARHGVVCTRSNARARPSHARLDRRSMGSS